MESVQEKSVKVDSEWEHKKERMPIKIGKVIGNYRSVCN